MQRTLLTPLLLMTALALPLWGGCSSPGEAAIGPAPADADAAGAPSDVPSPDTGTAPLPDTTPLPDSATPADTAGLDDALPDSAAPPDVPPLPDAAPRADDIDATSPEEVEVNGADAATEDTPAAQDATSDAVTPVGPAPQKGEFVITEVMLNPAGISDSSGEWVEILNASDEPLSLAQCTLSDDGSDTTELALAVGDLVVPPGAHWLLGSSSDATVNGGLTPDLQYAGFYLGNTSDEVILTCAGLEVDAVRYEAGVWPLTSGRSLSFDGALPQTDTANDVPTAWCAASTLYSVSNFGTPGAANPTCPVPDNTIDACRLKAPVSLELLTGTPFTVSALVFDADVTDINTWVDAHPELVAQVGIGAADGDPVGSPDSFTWHDAVGALNWSDEEAPGWDQYELTLLAPDSGSHQVLARFSLDMGQTWTACDLTGSDDGYDPANAGQLLTAADPCDPNPCLDAPPATCGDDGTTAFSSVAPGDCILEGLESQCVFATEAEDCSIVGASCDQGVCVGAAPHPEPGELIFTELMTNPQTISDSKGEWFEMALLGNHTVNLQDCLLQSGGESHIIDNGGGLLVEPGQVVLFARNGDSATNGGLDPDYAYSLISLGNLSDNLELRCTDMLIDGVAWNDVLAFPLLPGHAMQLHTGAFDVSDNDEGGNWCAATEAYTEDNAGSPGLPNGPCPGPDLCEGVVCNPPPFDSCNLGVASVFGPEGTCVDGTCLYEHTTTDCAAAGTLCIDGACTDTLDPCLPNPCVSAPAAVCEGNTLAIDATVGACSADATTGLAICSYPAADLDCAELGTTCEDAACVGMDFSPTTGSVIFNEFLSLPIASANPQGQWVELLNTEGSWIDIGDCVLEGDNAGSHLISPGAPLLIAPGGLVVLAASGTPAYNGGLQATYVVGADFAFVDTSDTLRLRCNELVIDEFSHSPSAWGSQPGTAWQLDSNHQEASANDDGSTWCFAQALFGKGDGGSPGQPNPPCPVANPVDWCRAEPWMMPAIALVGDEVSALAALRELPITGISAGTDPDPLVTVEMAIGPQSGDPEADPSEWHFTSALPATAWLGEGEQLNIDKYEATWVVDQAGELAVAFRVSVDQGLTWTYCDGDTGIEGEDGSENGFSTTDAIPLSAIPSPCEPNPCQAVSTGGCDGDLLTFTASPGTCAVDGTEAVCSYPESTMDCAAYGGACLDDACTGMAEHPTAGAVIITEFMTAPTSSAQGLGQWIELLNTSDSAVLMDGCVLSDFAGADSHTLDPPTPLLIQPGEVVVFGQTDNASTNGGVLVDYFYGGTFALEPGDDSIALTCSGVLVDSVVIDGNFPDSLGASVQLDADVQDADANDEATAWCPGYTPYGDGDLGSPGAPNPLCPTPTPIDWCRLQWPTSILEPTGATVTVYGHVYQAGVTDVTGAVDVEPLLLGQLAVGPDGTDPTVDDTGWSYIYAHANAAWSDETNPGNDEYEAALGIPAAGTYDYAFRFSADGGLTWTWCDLDGGTDGTDGSENGYQVEASGSLYASEGPCDPNPCEAGNPPQCSGDILLTEEVPGTCTPLQEDGLDADFECDFIQTTFDCAAAGGSCAEGGCVDIATTPLPGDLVFTEVMSNPQAVDDSKGEWVELQNVSGHKLDLEGCTLGEDAGAIHVISGGGHVIVATGAHFVMARNGDAELNGGVSADYTYGTSGSFNLKNSEETLTFTCLGNAIDQVSYHGEYPLEAGVSIQLDPDATDGDSNDDVARWCASPSPYGDGDLGSPGAPNAPCCLSKICDTPPPPSCDGELLAIPSGAGTCEAGVCSYPPATLLSCAETGQLCEVDACVTPANPVDHCRLQWPLEITTFPDETRTVYGRLYEQGLTDLTESVDASEMVMAEFWLGASSTDTDSWTLVGTGAPNPGWPGDEPGYDEVQADLPAPVEAGLYHYAMRVTVDGGQHWTWCDSDTGVPGEDGSEDGFHVDNAGEWTTVADPCTPNPCTVEGAPSASCADDTLSTYETEGLCERDISGTHTCSYTPTTLDCAGEGGSCADGSCDVPPPAVPTVGQVVITELMTNPDAVGDTHGEWIELTNTSSTLVTLAGCEVASVGEAPATLPTTESMVLKPGARMVLARSDDPAMNGGITAQFSYGSTLVLSNINDSVTLTCGSEVIDALDYDESTHPDIAGRSMQLNPSLLDAASNDVGSSWCTSTEWFGDGNDRGTPGAVNSTCLAPKPVDWCRMQAAPLTTAVTATETSWTARVYEGGMTDISSSVDTDSRMWVQAGYAADGSVLPQDGTGWVFVDAMPALGWDDASEPGNDEYSAVFNAPAVGDWDVAFRASVDAGLTWTGCDQDTGLDGQDGSEDGYQVERSGILLSIPDPCESHVCDAPPASACDGDMLNSWVMPGDCSVTPTFEPQCEYTETVIDCAALGGTCEGDGCEGVPTTPGPGDLLLTEFMMAPTMTTTANGQWLEYWNTTDGPLELAGCELHITGTFEGAGNSHQLADSPTVLLAGDFLVIGSNGDEDTNGGYIADIALPALTIGGAAEDMTIALSCGGQSVDSLPFVSATWQSLTDAPGTALQLDPDALDTNDPTSWCVATTPYGQGDLGTPNATNPSCTP